MIPIEAEDLRVLLEAGYMYLGMQRYPEAAEIFEGVIALAPNSEVPVVALGNVFCVQGKIDEAIKHYHQALKMAPNSAFATAYLGEALFFKEEKEKAIETLKQAINLEPKGSSAAFAQALIGLINKGFTPRVKPSKETNNQKA